MFTNYSTLICDSFLHKEEIIFSVFFTRRKSHSAILHLRLKYQVWNLTSQSWNDSNRTNGSTRMNGLNWMKSLNLSYDCWSASISSNCLIF